MTVTSLLPLLQTIKTKNNLAYFLEGIEQLIADSYKSPKSGDFHANMSDKLGQVTCETLKDICVKDSVNYDDMRSVVSLLEEIRSFIPKIPVFHIKIAFNPSETYVTKLYEKVSKLCGEIIVIDLEIDAFIVAGCVISYKGRYSDRSLYRDIDKFFESNKNYGLQYLQ